MDEPILLAIIGIAVIATAAGLAPRVNIAGPLLLVMAGLGVSLLPFVPAVEVDPEIILVGILPPLLYSAAVALPAIEFRRDFGPIAGLSVLLVVISSVGLGLFFAWAVPGLGVFLAIALGAILSPTDAVATSIVKRLGLSRRVVTMLEGESLLNDATSLVILRTAVAAVAAGTVQASEFVGAFVWGVLVAIVIGGAVGWLNLRFRAWVGDSAANTAVGFAVPFAAFLPTEHFGGSGLVAAVVAGIVTGQGAARWFTPEQRLSDRLNWRTAELVLEGAVFLVMGLELKEIWRQNLAQHEGAGRAFWLAAAALVIILTIRAGYVALLVRGQGRRARGKLRERLTAMDERLDQVGVDGPVEPRIERRVDLLRRRVGKTLADLDYYQASPIGWRLGTVIVWSGMRGVVTLAAAQTLPRDTEARELLILTAFLVAVASLLLQGFTLPWLVRRLELPPQGEEYSRDEQARIDDELRAAAAMALGRPGLRRADGSEFPAELIETVGARMIDPPDEDDTAAARDRLELRLLTIAAMRERLNQLSADGTFSSEALRRNLGELDADELSLNLRLRNDTD